MTLLPPDMTAFQLPLHILEKQEPLPDVIPSGAGAWTAQRVVKALHHKHPRPNWVYFPEMRIGTGYGKDAEQRIDAWAMNLMPSNHFVRYAYEVKVSRADYLVEMKKPWKRKHALLVSNHFYFATPKGLIQPAELPAECGLIEIMENGYPHIKVHAPWRDAMPVNMRFLASVCRRVDELERRNHLL